MQTGGIDLATSANIRTMTDEARPSGRRRTAGAVAGALGVCAVLALVYVVAFRGEAAAPALPAAPALDEDPPTLAGAIAKSRQWAGNDVDATTARSLVLVGWANRHLSWQDVDVKANETTAALVEKATDAEIGKRMCVAGKVGRVNMVRTDQATDSSGFLVTDDGQPFAFMAARNAGSAEERKTARLCGVVTGWNATESALGPPRAPVLVGMFEADGAPAPPPGR
jgi:hypothetical protein